VKHSPCIFLPFSIPKLLRVHGVTFVYFLLEFDVGDHQLLRVTVIAMSSQLSGVLDGSHHPLSSHGFIIFSLLVV
jgi:hypothetical protein